MSIRSIVRNGIIILTVPFLFSCSYRFYTASCPYPLPGPMEKQAILESELRETSGLQQAGDLIWTFNDSGGEAALYGISRSDGTVQRKTFLENTENIDWEDITKDSLYFYVADVGNNYGNRDTLMIYMVSKKEVLEGAAVVKPAGIIQFSYRDSVKSGPDGRSSHDCEAVFSYRDTLYLFTKNWTDRSTSVYKIPANPGYYSITPSATYQVDALVTAADIHPQDKEVTLLGYRNAFPVLVSWSYQSDPSVIHCGGRAKRYWKRWGRQVEGICYDRGGERYISSEERFHKPALFMLF